MSSAPRNPRTRYWVQSTKKELEGKLGTTFSLSNGLLGLRGAHEECPDWGRPEFYVADTYAAGPPALLGFHDPDHILTHPDRMAEDHLNGLGDDAIQTLPNLPFPVGVKLSVGDAPFGFDTHKILSAERLLEIDTAVMRRTLVFRDDQNRRTRVDSCRFVSMADHNLICLRAVVRRLNHQAPVDLGGFLFEDVANTNGVRLWTAGERLEQPGLRGLECLTRGTGLTIAIGQAEHVVNTDDEISLDLFAIAGTMSLPEACERVAAARHTGFDQCLQAHQESYAAQRRAGRVDFDGDAATVQGFNFGQTHMHMAAGPTADRSGLPIKGLTGHGYRFLTFWDMDFHMFPYYLMTKPRWARKLLEYRYNQLPKYRENARKWGAEGAQVPWETGARGEEETAPWLCLQEREIHISADAAYMFKRYAEMTGDQRVMLDMGAEFAFETARFYASRLVWNETMGRFDLPDIGCPDQYHTFADNNVFISLWAQWNLSHAADLFAQADYQAAAAAVGVDAREAARWRNMAEKIHIIPPDADGVIEEFDGFFDLDADIDGICETYCSHSQAVKQPDVLAAFIPFEDRYDVETRRKNWRFYDARTLHGSSLSLPGMAYAAARCGLNDEALYNLHKSCRMDLDDVNLDTERGVHLSGGAVQWCAVVHGFGGLTASGEGLTFHPNLPRQWRWLSFAVHWHFQLVDVEITEKRITVTVGAEESQAVPVRVQDGAWVSIPPGETREWTLEKSI
ncbi:MAG: glycosyl hydrolase family 65 protein [Lentisphaeria bacterium]|nr:glycosyl hydrolase family 65 protein [Lentisphaeria bacterium]